MAGELQEVQLLRLKLKAARNLLRDLGVAAARAEDALERARNAQPEEGTANESNGTKRIAERV